MFTTLNLRWIIDLKEREMRANWIGNPQPRWLQALVSLFRRLTLFLGSPWTAVSPAPARTCRFLTCDQSGRTSPPIIPHRVQTHAPAQ